MLKIGKERDCVYFNFPFAIKLAIGLNVFLQDPSSLGRDLTTRFLAQFYPPGRTAKLQNDIFMFQQHQGESLSEAWTRFNDVIQKVPHHGIDLWLQAISLPQDVPNASDHRLIKLENQVQRLMEAHLPPKPSIQVNKIAYSCEICSGPHDTNYCMENPEQAFVDYASSRTDKAGDARLSKFEADFKQQQSEITIKIDTFLKAINDRMMGALPSDMVKNSKLNVNPTSSVLSARSYPIVDPQNMEKEPACPLLVGRGFLATASVVIDCRKAKNSGKRRYY
ncbi:MAK10-like protein [Tanacetum coccineum]